MLVMWLIALCIVFPYTSSLSTRDGVCHNWAWTPVQLFTYYAIYVNLSSFIPALLLILVYSTSIYVLSRKEIPGSEDKKFSARRRNEFVRIMKMFACVAVIFFMLTTPYMIVHFVTSYYGTFDLTAYCRNSRVFTALQYGFYTLSHFNACVNPFIYAKMHTSMKRHVIKHISHRWKAFTLTKRLSLSNGSLHSAVNCCEQYNLVPVTSFGGSHLMVYGRH